MTVVETLIRRRALPALSMLCLLAAAPAAQAACNLLCSCSTTTTNLVFGNYNPLAFGNTDTTGTITVKCGGVAGLAIPYTVDLGKGNAATYAGRYMTGGGSQLSYNLYGDSMFTQVWGDGTASTVRASGNIGLDLLGLSPGIVYTVHGRIPGRQLTVIPGSYSDSVTVTLTYQ